MIYWWKNSCDNVSIFTFIVEAVVGFQNTIISKRISFQMLVNGAYRFVNMWTCLAAFALSHRRERYLTYRSKHERVESWTFRVEWLRDFDVFLPLQRICMIDNWRIEFTIYGVGFRMTAHSWQRIDLRDVIIRGRASQIGGLENILFKIN